MKIPNEYNLDRYQWEDAIDRWIFDEEHRAIVRHHVVVFLDAFAALQDLRHIEPCGQGAEGGERVAKGMALDGLVERQAEWGEGVALHHGVVEG